MDIATSSSGPTVLGRSRWLEPLNTVGLIAVAGLWAGYCAWYVDQHRTVPLDIDGWGYMIARLKDNGHDFWSLFHEPSLWKGPVVPFIFSLVYYLFPFDQSVLVFNAVAVGLAAGIFFRTFRNLGASRLTANLAILCSVFYFPHDFIVGYYYAEPWLALLNATLLWTVARAVYSGRPSVALLAGALAGLLLLSRAPYILIVLGIPVVLWYHFGAKRIPAIASFGLGLFLTFAPWPIHNFLVHHAFIPFTLEGGKILFLGVYLPADDGRMADFRAIPEFERLEQAEQGMTPTQQYAYWQGMAIQRIKEDPLGQLVLCVKKTMRFWVFVPTHSWMPTWKTLVVAAVCFPLAILGLVVHRRLLLAQLCALWFGGLWLIHTFLHSELRYNFPVLPMMFMLAALGAAALWSHASNRGLTLSSAK